MANIIVVDDDKFVCDALDAKLSLDGHVVRASTSAEGAIDIGHLFKTDLLIADWNLESEYDGFEVALAISEVQKNLQTIMITGYTEIGKPPEGLSVFGKLEKPFTVESLYQMVDQALGA